MRIRVTYRSRDLQIDEVLEGADAEAIVRMAQQRVAAKAGLLPRLFINSLSPLQFACEVVKRYNHETGSALPLPLRCEEFIETAREAGIVTILGPKGATV
jgi:hypothetical protein